MTPIRRVVGSVVAPIWPPTGGGSAMGSEEDRQKFNQQVKKEHRRKLTDFLPFYKKPRKKDPDVAQKLRERFSMLAARKDDGR